MTRRAIPIAAGWFSGLFTAFALCVCGGLSFFGLIAAAAAAGTFAIIFRLGFSRRAIAFLGAFAAATAYSAIYTNLILNPLEALDGKTEVISGKVVSYTEGDRSLVVIKGNVKGIPARAAVYINGFSGDYGDFVTCEAVLSEFDDTAFFAARQNYLPDGILIGGRAISCDTAPSEITLFDRLRAYSGRVSREIMRYAGNESGELMSALTTGDRSSYSEKLRIKLNRAGVGHIAAVSGLHVSIIAAAVFFVCRKLRFCRFLNAALTETAVIMFVVFSGLRVSAIRSAIMLTAAITAALFLKRQDILNTICITALLMTLWNPYSAADMSSVLSLAGVTGVAVTAPAVSKEYKLKGKISRAICASVCAVFASLPFAAFWFDVLSFAAPLSNLFAIPLCTLCLICGMLFALTGCAFPIFARIGGFFSGLVVSLSDFVSRFSLTAPLGSRIAAFALIILFIVPCAVYLITKNIRKSVRAALALTAVFLVGNAAAAISSQNRYELYALQNGENSGLLLRKGSECIIIDFDGGLAGSARVMERLGIRQIDAALPLENAGAAYSAYLEAGAETVFLLDDVLADGEKIMRIGRGAVIDAFGAEITLDGGVSILLPDKTVIRAAKDNMPDGDVGIAFLNGLTVIRSNGASETYKGDCFVLVEGCWIRALD